MIRENKREKREGEKEAKVEIEIVEGTQGDMMGR